jgi:hypothetical protein
VPVCLINPSRYAHAGALAELAETVRYGLEALALPDEPTVVLGAHLDPGAVPDHCIVYNTEALSADWCTHAYWKALHKHGITVWDYALPNLTFSKARFVPVGYMPQLTRIPKADPQDIDVLFYGSMNKRRADVLGELRQRGLHVEALFGIYGAQRDAYIARSKVVLNMHYYEDAPFEIVRVSYLWANRKCVVSEVGGNSSFGVDYDRLVPLCVELVNNDHHREQDELNGYGYFSQISEIDILREALCGPR